MSTEEIVWAKISRVPWWPGTALRDSEEEAYCEVTFFGDNTSERVHRNHTKPYLAHRSKYESASLKACRNSAIHPLLKQAIAEADRAICYKHIQPEEPETVRHRTQNSKSMPGNQRRGKLNIESNRGKRRPKSTVCADLNLKQDVPNADVAVSTPKKQRNEVMKRLRISSSDDSDNETLAKQKLKTLKQKQGPGHSTKSDFMKVLPRVAGSITKRLMLIPSCSPRDAPYDEGSSLKIDPSPPFADTPRKEATTAEAMIDDSSKQRSKVSVKPLADNIVTEASASSDGGENWFQSTPNLAVASEDTHNGSDSSSSDDELLPSFNDMLCQSFLRLEKGSLIWLKYRRLPWWPVLITRVSSTGKYAIMFLNSDNSKQGLLIRLNKKNHEEFPGRNYRSLAQSSTADPKSGSVIQTALTQTDDYLRLKAKQADLDPRLFFFPNEDVLDLEDEAFSGSEHGTEPLSAVTTEGEVDVSDSDGDHDESIQTVCATGAKPPPPPEYSRETLALINEREKWLASLLAEMESDTGRTYLAKLCKGARDSPATVPRERGLGPFLSSNDELIDQLLNLVRKVVRREMGGDFITDKDNNMFSYIIPEVILKAIENVDGSDREKALDKFHSDLDLEEEKEYKMKLAQYHHSLTT